MFIYRELKSLLSIAECSVALPYLNQKTNKQTRVKGQTNKLES